MRRSRPRRRIRRIAGVGLVLALLAWLGIEIGWGPAPQDSQPDRDEPGAAAGARPTPDAPDDPPVDVDTDPPPPDEPDVETSSLAGQQATESPPDDRAAVADHLWGLLRAIASDRPDRAFAACEDAEQLALNDAERAQLAEAVTGFRERSRKRIDDSLELAARDGRVLSGVGELRIWFESERDDARALLASAFEAVGVPMPTRGGTVDVEQVALLPRGLAVRVRHDTSVVDGEVVESRGDEVTVRLPGPRGYTFPTVDRTLVEPADADPDRAAGQAAAALRRGDRLLAALWIARSRVVGADAQRLDQLSAALAR